MFFAIYLIEVDFTQLLSENFLMNVSSSTTLDACTAPNAAAQRQEKEHISSVHMES